MSIILRRASEQGSTYDSRVEGAVSVGRATDNTIELPGLLVALHHLRVLPVSAVAVRAECLRGADITVNGRPGQRVAELHAGDEIGLGPHRIRVGVMSAEGPVVLEVIPQAVATDAAGDANAPTSLAQAGWRQRRWAYGAGGAVLFMTLLLPLILRLIPAAADAERWLPSDHLWSSGPISNAHLAFGSDCSSCHVSVFERVPDTACLECHAGIRAHADDPAVLMETALDTRRCASCHFEHSGPHGIRNDHDGLCADCHQRPEDFSSLAGSVAIDGFDHAHPAFRVEVGTITEDGRPGLARTLLDAQTRDLTGLIFPHALHLDADGIRGPDGTAVLDCDSCHQPARGGFGFQPMNFEVRCQSCHQLDVDFGGDVLRLPHGDSAWVRAALGVAVERARLKLDPEPMQFEARQRGRPGEAADRGPEPEPINQIDDVFERRVCGKCHAVDRPPGEPLRIVAPRLRQTWMVRARFTHAPHDAVACVTCHAAAQAEDSDALLLPQIQTCRTCHGTVDSFDRFETRCADCHQYHQGSVPHHGKFTGALADEPGDQG